MTQTRAVLSRYTDIADEPSQIHPPIKGYEEVELVSLEEAVKPISNLFPSIGEYVWVAKQNCRHPHDGLTHDESASIFLYTMEFIPEPSLYKELNAALRAENRGSLKIWFHYLKLFLTATYKLPSERCKIWRGVPGLNLSSTHPIGREFVWWGVSSCTMHAAVLENEQFLSKTGPRTIFSIECRNGKKITGHSFFKKKEGEVILLPGSYLRVKSALSFGDGGHLIDLEEISPPFPLIAAPFTSAKQSVHSVSVLKIPVSAQQTPEAFDDDVTSHNLAVVKNVLPAPKPNPDKKETVQPTISTPSGQTTSSQTYISPFTPSYVTVQPNGPDSNTRQRIVAIVIPLFLVFIALPLAALLMGQLYKNNCPIQTWIPQWLTIFGAVGLGAFALLAFIVLIASLCCSGSVRTAGYAAGFCIACPLLLFFVAWLIAGSVWVFPVYKKVQFNQNSTANFCDETLFKFSFGTLLAQYGLIGLLICCGGCIGVIVVFSS